MQSILAGIRLIIRRCLGFESASRTGRSRQRGCREFVCPIFEFPAHEESLSRANQGDVGCAEESGEGVQWTTASRKTLFVAEWSECRGSADRPARGGLRKSRQIGQQRGIDTVRHAAHCTLRRIRRHGNTLQVKKKLIISSSEINERILHILTRTPLRNFTVATMELCVMSWNWLLAAKPNVTNAVGKNEQDNFFKKKKKLEQTLVKTRTTDFEACSTSSDAHRAYFSMQSLENDVHVPTSLAIKLGFRNWPNLVFLKSNFLIESGFRNSGSIASK